MCKTIFIKSRWEAAKPSPSLIANLYALKAGTKEVTIE